MLRPLVHLFRGRVRFFQNHKIFERDQLTQQMSGRTESGQQALVSSFQCLFQMSIFRGPMTKGRGSVSGRFPCCRSPKGNAVTAPLYPSYSFGLPFMSAFMEPQRATHHPGFHFFI